VAVGYNQAVLRPLASPTLISSARPGCAQVRRRGGIPTVSFSHLLVEREPGVAIVTVNRPKALNALTRDTLDEIRSALLELMHDDGVRSIIVTGAGDRAFVAGADIADLARLDAAGAHAYALAGQSVMDLIEHAGKPVIAAVNGFALGGGCELAMACTIRVAAETATFGLPEVKLGLIPGFGGTLRLARLVGRGRALEAIVTGRMIDAAEALAVGLVSRVVPAVDLLDDAKATARALASHAPVAIRYAIEAVCRGGDMPVAEGERLEASLFGLAAATEDMREGTTAFLEKRKPAFKGK
jgi:enoyl-CoA hydratase/carnithine racemase